MQDIYSLSVVRFTNIFSHYVGCLFILLKVSFDAEVLILMKSNLPILFFVAHAFGIIS